MNKITIEQVFDAIRQERTHQQQKWGVDKQQSLPGFMLIMRKELSEAEEGWAKNIRGKHACLNEIVQLAATCVACLEKYGIDGSAIATDDEVEA